MFVYTSVFSFMNLKDKSHTEFSLKKQIEDNIFNTDFEKNSLKERVMNLIRFVPYTEQLLSKVLNVKELLKSNGDHEF